MDPDPAGFRVVGSGPDPAGTKMSRSGLDLDPAGYENCGSGAPLIRSLDNWSVVIQDNGQRCNECIVRAKMVLLYHVIINFRPLSQDNVSITQHTTRLFTICGMERQSAPSAAQSCSKY